MIANCLESIYFYTKQKLVISCFSVSYTIPPFLFVEYYDMSKNTFIGNLKKVPTNKIQLNINNLTKGKYTLKVINKNKVLKTVRFIKK